MKRKKKALISCAVTAQLICGFVFAYAKCRLSHAVVHFFFFIISIDSKSDKTTLVVFFSFQGYVVTLAYLS